jgi:hypothetical protein
MKLRKERSGNKENRPRKWVMTRLFYLMIYSIFATCSDVEP